MTTSPAPFVPTDFEIPARLETAEFKLRMLTVDDVVKDYDAVVSSVEHLKTIWPGGSVGSVAGEGGQVELTLLSAQSPEAGISPR